MAGQELYPTGDCIQSNDDVKGIYVPIIRYHQLIHFDWTYCCDYSLHHGKEVPVVLFLDLNQE